MYLASSIFRTAHWGCGVKMMAGVGEVSAETSAGIQEREGELGGPRFTPPLYRQRYEFVLSACRRLQAYRVH